MSVILFYYHDHLVHSSKPTSSTTAYCKRAKNPTGRSGCHPRLRIRIAQAGAVPPFQESGDSALQAGKNFWRRRGVRRPTGAMRDEALVPRPGVGLKLHVPAATETSVSAASIWRSAQGAPQPFGQADGIGLASGRPSASPFHQHGAREPPAGPPPGKRLGGGPRRTSASLGRPRTFLQERPEVRTPAELAAIRDLTYDHPVFWRPETDSARASNRSPTL